jgi:glycerol-3-phosphate dehydrogenase (NAD(P)+)
LNSDTGQLLHEVAEEVLGKSRKLAVLSGPSFAREVASGLPTAVVIASKHQDFLMDLVHRFNSPLFTTYTSDDVIGVEIGGVVKNVIAIATGISDGMNFGANARTALITSGLAEMMRLGIALGGKVETFMGLSGIGDLILSATDDQSRNRRLGLGLGKGQDLDQTENEIGQVVEGKRNAELVALLAEHHGIEMPICDTVWKVLKGKLDVNEAIMRFFSHASKSEISV